ncbi:hypothetical protein ASC74_11405 [Pseudomonas sp. Root329]|uniref:AAA family ATPase n=1 Tax=Pseudomonas sp. Root329 TaxID=1736515 RepID=UPI0006F50536|nr:AAA family ATPase [Pseudomonas sp. Root329]KQV10650.1 hypothetical protein ASC74_11405 [Pseudomonas sp. Root329]
MEFYFSKSYSDLPEGIHLIQDHVGTNFSSPWNDYDYIVTFNAILIKNKETSKIGEIKILVDNQVNTSKFFLEKGIKLDDGKSSNITDVLDPSNTVSLASDISFYKIINKLFSAEEATELLSGICDAGYYYENYEVYKKWPGFDNSLLRQGTAAEARIKKGFQIATGRYAPESSFKIEIDSLPETFEPIEFNFDNQRELGVTNINLLIGKNGTGKTHILKHLTEIITGIEPSTTSWPYFHKLVVAAYSPFETFYTNNDVIELLVNKYAPQKLVSRELTKSKRRRLLKTNKYSYIGYKNDSGKFQLEWPKEYSAKSLIKIIEDDKLKSLWLEQSRFEILKNTLKISINFDALGFKSKENKNIIINEGFLISPELFSKNVDTKSGICFFHNGVEVPLSSGQVIYSYLIPALAAEIEEESLVILDEPELYLHPNLEVGLISMLKNLLKKTSSYAVIATHSAVLAREIDRDGINILKRSASGTISVKPSFETFGGSLDSIIGEVFDDYSESKPFQLVIDKKIEGSTDHSALIKSISLKIGDEALAYITSKLNPMTDTIVFEEK